ncbi:hypothetical protein WR25_17672 [Diploscapter pachys]|uniref:Uncharacterized protein n=1 Tax=Diploscapter pachys TaxID=2018661 RepID=A0A2A2KBN1_9BILA|nr:hypothetical protein WR25_17672 [Diploscapter pachys]
MIFDVFLIFHQNEGLFVDDDSDALPKSAIHSSSKAKKAWTEAVEAKRKAEAEVEAAKLKAAEGEVKATRMITRSQLKINAPGAQGNATPKVEGGSNPLPTSGTHSAPKSQVIKNVASTSHAPAQADKEITLFAKYSKWSKNYVPAACIPPMSKNKDFRKKLNEKARQRRQENIEEVRAYDRERRQKNIEKVRARDRERWARIKDEENEKRRWRYRHDKDFREKCIKECWQWRQNQAANRELLTPEDPIHNLYLWVAMGKGGFWERVRYAGRTVQSVKARWQGHKKSGKRDEERYKDRMVKKIAWMKKVKSGQIRAKIVHIGGLTEAEVELAEYSIVSQLWEEFGKEHLLNKKTPKIQALTRDQIKEVAEDFMESASSLQPPSTSACLLPASVHFRLPPSTSFQPPSTSVCLRLPPSTSICLRPPPSSLRLPPSTSFQPPSTSIRLPPVSARCLPPSAVVLHPRPSSSLHPQSFSCRALLSVTVQPTLLPCSDRSSALF